MKDNVLKANPTDNVVVAIRDIQKGDQVVLDGRPLLEAGQDVKTGHKIALSAIKAGMPVVRYGEVITRASCNILAGAWVHMHNTSSELDLKHK